MAKTNKQIVDPEELRWHKKYPEYPGVAACVEMLRRGNIHGVWINLICHELKEHAAETADELIAAFGDEQNTWVKLMLLSVMEEACLPVFQSLFIEQLTSEDEDLRKYAMWGLEKLGTKEARTALWEVENGKR